MVPIWLPTVLLKVVTNTFPYFSFCSLLVVLLYKIFKLNIGTTDWESYLTFVDNVHSYGKGFIWGDGYEKSRMGNEEMEGRSGK